MHSRLVNLVSEFWDLSFKPEFGPGFWPGLVSFLRDHQVGIVHLIYRNRNPSYQTSRGNSVFKNIHPKQVLQFVKKNIKIQKCLVFITVVRKRKITWKIAFNYSKYFSSWYQEFGTSIVVPNLCSVVFIASKCAKHVQWNHWDWAARPGSVSALQHTHVWEGRQSCC